MNAQEQIDKFQEFLEAHYSKELHEAVQKGLHSITVDFSLLAQNNIELSEDILENPEDAIKSAEIVVQHLGIDSIDKHFRIRISNLPKSQQTKIRNIRSNNLGKLISFEGLVRQASDVRPQVTSAKFECPACGNTITLLQLEPTFREPYKCSCGRKGRFRLLSKELVDSQRLVIEESPEAMEGGEQPKRLSVFLREDLVEPKMERRTTPGTKIRVIGTIKEVPIPAKSGAPSTRFDLACEANFIEPIEETFEEIEISQEDERKIMELSKDPKLYEKLIASIAPSIKGHEDIKGALVLQLMGGVRKQLADGTKIKGDMHVLLVGDPGSAKSTLLLFMSKAAPKSRYIAGRGATAAGLCVAPDSLIPTNPGGIHQIKEMVEKKLNNNSEEYLQGIWRAKDIKDIRKVFTLDKNMRVKTSEIGQFWKIAPPEYMVKLQTRSGKEVIVTPNTKLFSIKNGELIWKEASAIKERDYLASAANLNFENYNKLITITLIDSNPIVYGVKKDIKKIIDSLCRNKETTIRQLSKKLGLNENKLYHNWINEKARGNLHLKDILKLIEISNYDIKKLAENITYLSLRRGKKIKIPVHIDEDFMYFAGLIAGDGDIYANGGRGSIRFNNNSPELQKEFKRIVNKLFGKSCSLSQKRSDSRSESWRFNSKLIVDILRNLGIPQSPKSDKIDMTNTLLTLPDNMISSFIRGCFDTDGSVTERENGGVLVDITSTSKKFIKKLQLVLMRFGIQSKVRIRPPSAAIRKDGKPINSKLEKYILEIKGKKYLEIFKDRIGFKSKSKKDKLTRITNSIKVYHSNIEVIPGAKKILAGVCKKYRLKSKNIFGYKTSSYYTERFQLSKQNLKKIVSNLKKYVIASDPDLNKLSILADSEIIWEEVIKKEEIYDHGYDFVYDLTIENAHNFIVNGLVVHNTATVVKDEFLRGWALEAGALVLASGGFVMLDEMDKISEEDTSALHEALAQQQISIAKANIQATLKAQTTLLAAANPKLGRFDPYHPIAGQINMPPALINRFDLIFPVRDIPNKEKDEQIASHILRMYQSTETSLAPIPIELLKKYSAYARQKIQPKLTKGAVEEIKSFYVGLRNMGFTGTEPEQAIRPIPISARQLESLVLLSEASARVRLSNQVTREDAKKAISILKYCLMQVGFDYETGQIDIDRITTGISTASRSRFIIIRDIIDALQKDEKKTVPLEEINALAHDKGLTDSQIDEVLEKMKREGTIFEPKRGFIQKII